MSLYERLSGARTDTADDQSVDGQDMFEAPSSAATDPLSEIRRRTHLELVRALGPRLYDQRTSPEALEEAVKEQLTEVLRKEATPLSQSERQRLVAETLDDILGYGPLEALLNDDTVTEVMCNGSKQVFVEREGHLHLSDAYFLDDGHLRRTIEKIVGQVGRRIDESQPYVDARLPDGSRVNAIIPPIALDGPSLTIRKFAKEKYTAHDLVTFGTWSQKVAAFIDACVRGRMNIIVAGGTGAGKTTTLNVLSNFIPDDERIVTIEDAAELQLTQPHLVRLESRPPNIEGRGAVTIRDLVRNSLRMRPDRIVVGEVRGGEALDMLQAMNTGHDGSISTVHSNSPRDTLARLETMVLMAGVDLPVRAIREQIASAVQFVIHQSRLKDGTRRISAIAEVTGMEGDIITMQDIYKFDWGMGVDHDTGRALGYLKPTGIRPKVAEELVDHGVQIDTEWFEPEAFAKDEQRAASAGTRRKARV